MPTISFSNCHHHRRINIEYWSLFYIRESTVHQYWMVSSGLCGGHYARFSFDTFWLFVELPTFCWCYSCQPQKPTQWTHACHYTRYARCINIYSHYRNDHISHCPFARIKPYLVAIIDFRLPYSPHGSSGCFKSTSKSQRQEKTGD